MKHLTPYKIFESSDPYKELIGEIDKSKKLSKSVRGKIKMVRTSGN